MYHAQHFPQQQMTLATWTRPDGQVMLGLQSHGNLAERVCLTPGQAEAIASSLQACAAEARR